MTEFDCPACLNGCGGTRSDCPKREGGPLVRPAVGRPSSYTEDVSTSILDLIALGQSLRSICERSDMPDRTTVIRWLGKHDEFAARYARARELQADAMDDLILDTAEATDHTNHQASRVKIDAYKWRASKLKPKVYGDRTQLEHSGPGGGPIASATITTSDPAEAARIYQRIISGDGE